MSSALLPSSVVVCLSSYTPRRFFLLKALKYYCFLAFRRIGEYISPRSVPFVNLTSSCSLIPQILLASLVCE